MVKKFILFLVVLMAAFPVIASAAEFTATVDRNSVAVGENFTLQLTLSGTQAKDAPDLHSLRQDFTVVSQGQSSNTTIINGKVTSSTGWELALIPKIEGTLTIPAVSIETSDGTLLSQPITIDVGKAASLPSESQNGQTTITAHASTLNPYKGQPFFYTVKIVARGNVADLSLGDLSVDNAIVQSKEKPKIYDEVENGTQVKVIEARYIITPLASGKITIPAMLLKGKVQSREQNLSDDAFDHAFADPFGMLGHIDMLTGFAHYKPFTLASNEVQLDVKPAAVVMDPWLPLTSLDIKEDWDNAQTIRVGDSLTRKITLLADGAIGKQLPSLESQQNHTDFKVYVDKPVTEDNTSGATIIGTRKENYNLIPLKEGKLVLPEIKVPWWDIKNNHIAYASLPARTLDVLPALTVQGQSAATAPTQTILSQEPQVVVPAQIQKSIVPSVNNETPPMVYIVFGILSVVLLSLLWWVVHLQKKIASLHESSDSNVHTTEPVLPQTKLHPLGTSDLNASKTAQEISNVMRDYAAQHWGVQKNAPLEIIFADMVLQNRLQKEIADTFVRNLTASLYAGKEVDVEQLKEQGNAIIHSVRQAKNNNAKSAEKLPGLNPN